MTNTGFDTKVYTVELDDYNGEYGDFAGVAAKQNALWDLYEANTNEEMARGGKGTNGTGENLWARLPRIQVTHRSWESDADCCDHWTLTGGAGGLRGLYKALLTELATPAWHWYGMGGDDHAYDYWPNGMAMAVEFRTELLKIAELELAFETEAGVKGLTDPYHTTYLAEDLNRVYWLCRLRYERDFRRGDASLAGATDALTAFDDFLDAEHFGNREDYA